MSLWTNADTAIMRTVSGTGTITLGTTVTLTVGATTGMVVGDVVKGPGIGKGTTIASITNATTFVLSKAATNAVGVSVYTYGPDADKPKYVQHDLRKDIYGFDVAETAKTPVTHAGWVKVTTGTGGRAGRKQYETLVAMSSVVGAALDDAFAPEPTITTFALPANLVAQVINAAVSCICTVTPATGLTGTITYQWQKSANGTTGWTNVTGQTSTTLSSTASGVALTTEFYRLQAKIGTKVIGTSANWTVTTA